MQFGLPRIAGGSPLDHVVQHPLKEVPADLGFLTPDGVITVLSDQIVMMIVAGLLLAILLPIYVRRRRGTGEVDRLVPAGPSNFIETICQYLRKEVAEPSLGPYTDRFIKFIWTLFFFILTVNLLGLVPLGSVTPAIFGVHIGGTATANIWVTATLAIVTLLLMVINGFRLGGMEYIKHFCPGPLYVAPLLVPIEIMGVFAKAFALAVRLFANMVAGHILLAVLVGFILSAGAASTAGGFAIAVPVVLASIAINLLEIFVAFLQAFIFTFLTALFIGMSIVFHHGDDHAGAHAH